MKQLKQMICMAATVALLLAGSTSSLAKETKGPQSKSDYAFYNGKMVID